MQKNHELRSKDVSGLLKTIKKHNSEMWTPQPDFFQTTSQTFGERSRWWKTAVFGSPRCSPNGPLCGEVWQHCSSRAGGRKKSLTSLLWWHMMIYTGSPKFFRILVDFPRISTKSFRLIWICFVGDDIPLNPSQIFSPRIQAWQISDENHGKSEECGNGEFHRSFDDRCLSYLLAWLM